MFKIIHFKVIFIITFFILLFPSLTRIKSSKEKTLSDAYVAFTKEISNYETYQSSLLTKYYERYLLHYNYILALNEINHPYFFQYELGTKSYLNVNNLLLINKTHLLPAYYLPIDLIAITSVSYIKRENETMLLNKEALNAYQNLFKDLTNLGYELTIFSGYRHYEKQKKLYDEATDKSYVAYPGSSEHQSGLALDVSLTTIGLTTYFDKTSVFTYLKDIMHLYGFILRYPSDKTNITGYPYEPWHLRYVGKEIATIIYTNNLTLEEYYYQYCEINN